MLCMLQTLLLPGAVPRGGAGGPLAPCAPHLRGIRTESLLCISCLFNAIMFCDILMIYIRLHIN